MKNKAWRLMSHQCLIFEFYRNNAHNTGGTWIIIYASAKIETTHS